MWIISGLPHDQEKSGIQEKSGKAKKIDISQVKMGIFEKIQENSEIFFLNHQILSFKIYKIPYIQKPSTGKKKFKSLIKIPKFS